MEPRERRQRFDEMYAEHHVALHAFFLGRVSDHELALDLLQELFLRLWRSIATVDALPAERRHFWLYAAARNLVIDAYRRRGASQAASDRLRQLAPPTPTEAAEAGALENTRLAELDSAIQRLPEDVRVVLVLSVVGQRNSTEIGELLGRPPGTVRYQLAHARRLLAEALRLEESV